MNRSTWELSAYVRHHIAELTEDRRACSPIAESEEGLAGPMTRLRRRLGIAFIKAGHALAGYEAMRGLPTAPARAATWGTGS